MPQKHRISRRPLSEVELEAEGSYDQSGRHNMCESPKAKKLDLTEDLRNVKYGCCRVCGSR